MPAKTLLQAVQDILERAYDDEVTATTDTDSAKLAKKHLEIAFNKLNLQFDWPSNTVYTHWSMPASVNKPTSFTVPTGTKRIVEVRYIIDGPTTETDESNYTKVIQYLDPRDFINEITNRDSNWSDTVEVEIDATTSLAVPIRTNKDPEYWSSLDGNTTVILDSYKDSDTGDMSDERVMFYAEMEPTFPTSDGTTIPIPAPYMPLLHEEAFELYAASLGRDSDAALARRNAKRMKTSLLNNKNLDFTPRNRYNPTRRGSR